MSTPTQPRTIADLDVSLPELEARLRAGRRAEVGHLLHDVDPDSTEPALVVSLAKPVLAGAR